MSDFLSKFEDENYDGEKIESSDEESNPSNNDSNNYQNDELIVKDNNYSSSQKKRKILLIISGALSLILIIFLVFIFSLIKIPNFTDADLAQAKSWSQKTGITLIIKEEYSNDKDENIIINQNKKAGERILKGSDLEITVSKGADPDEKIEVPNLEYMDINSINDWIDKNKLDNVELKGVYSSRYDKNKVISISYEGDFVNEKNYYRKDTMIIKISKGKASLKKNIIVPDFKETDIYEVKDWAEENGVTVYYLYSTHEKKPKNSIIKQSIKKETKISTAQTLTVTVSLGKSIKVPDFSTMTKSTANSYSSLKLNIQTKYHSSVKYGKLISQSIAAGTYVTSSTKITLVYSEGRPFIEDISGYTKKDVEKYFYNLNLKGAKLKYTFKYKSSKNEEIKQNTVLATSVQDDYAKFGQTIVVYLKK